MRPRETEMRPRETEMRLPRHLTPHPLRTPRPLKRGRTRARFCKNFLSDCMLQHKILSHEHVLKQVLVL